MTERMVMEIPIRVTLSIRYASQHGPLGDAVLAFGKEGSPGRRIGSASSPSLYREGRDANKPRIVTNDITYEYNKIFKNHGNYC